ncbi:hypothetical protein Tco_0059677 [Tanacetum coccineum]
MTRSIVKKPTEPLEEPERELHRRRKAACRQQRNESLAIARRNLFDDEASSSANFGPNPSSSLKSLREHSSPNSSGFQNPIVLPAEQTGNILDSRDIWLIQGVCTFQGLKSKNPIHHIKHYLDDSWDDPPSPMIISSISEIIKPTLEGRLRKASIKEPEGEETTTTQGKETPQSHILYHPSKSSGMPFLSRLKKQQRDDNDERLLSIFRQIHINLPFLEVMIHMPKGAKVLKDLLLHKEKLKKAASSVKLNEECSTIIQRSLPQKEGYAGSFTLPCLIRPLAVKNALADFGASINLIKHIDLD